MAVSHRPSLAIIHSTFSEAPYQSNQVAHLEFASTCFSIHSTCQPPNRRTSLKYKRGPCWSPKPQQFDFPKPPPNRSQADIAQDANMRPSLPS